MKRKWKQILCGTLVGLLVATAAPAAFSGNGYVTEVEAASKKAKPKLNKTKISVKTGKTYTLKVHGTTRMPKWKSSNKKVATVSKTGKVTAKKAGTAKITATIGKTRLTCTVNVKKASTGSSKYTKNYTKVKKYLNKKGKVDSDGTRYIEKKIDAHTTAILGYDPKTNKLDIGLAIIDKKADVSSAVDVLVNCSKSATAEAISAIFGDGNETYATAKFNANSYTGKKDVTFRKLSGSKAPKSIQKASNATLQAAIAGANYILSSKLHMTVKDLGFTAYQ